MSVGGKEVREGYKMTELGEIPEEWEVLGLGQVSEVILGQSPLSKSYNEEGIGLPFFQGKSEFGSKYPVARKWCDQPIKIAENGDILFSVRAPVGEVNISNQKSCIGRGLAAIRSNKVSQLYLYFYLKFKKNLFSSLSQGSTFTAINGNDLRTIKLALPPLPEQQKIAEILSTVDEQLETIEGLIEKTKELKKGLMQRLLTKGIGHTKFKQTELGEIPVEWEVVKLGNIAERIIQKNKDNISKNVLTISAQYGLVSQTDFFNKRVASKNLEGYYVLEKGDFAYNKSYSNGFPMGAIKSLELYELGIVSSLYICFRFKKGLINSEFIKQYYSFNIWHKEIGKVAQEGARNHGLLNISAKDFFETSVISPPISEQQKIASILLSVDEQVDIYEQEKEKVTELKKGLMQQLLTGKIRVTV